MPFAPHIKGKSNRLVRLMKQGRRKIVRAARRPLFLLESTASFALDCKPFRSTLPDQRSGYVQQPCACAMARSSAAGAKSRALAKRLRSVTCASGFTRPAMGRLRVNAPPILEPGGAGDLARFTDPVPQALVLTAIVIGFAMTALFLVVLLASRGFTGTDHGAAPDVSPLRRVPLPAARTR